MYSQQELDDAVASGALSAEAADALRAHVERQRSTAIPDEEQFWADLSAAYAPKAKVKRAVRLTGQGVDVEVAEQ